MNKTVLVVDDDKLIRQGLVAALKETGLNIVEAENGQQGLDIALSGKVDMVVTDVRMPEMDGLTMIEQLRKDERGHSMPVIILSVHEDPAILNDALCTGVTTYLSKETTSPSVIADQVQEVLR